ncbi:type IV secretion system DNA-binding domain-containing protein [Yoonia sp. GPGPB17]|uniref:type IV secretion system DNA-binding domain-containing protein n=1 Tax=Yoonia sp. GPGPB17 TaxID=3026147 RepID=UPI0030C037B3
MMAKTVSSASTLIRGGQTAQHWWRMGWQVLRFATVVGALIYVCSFVYLVARTYNPSEMRIAFYYEMAERGVVGQNGFDQLYTFKDLTGDTITVPAVQIYRNTEYRRIRDGFFYTFHSSARLAGIPAVLLGLLSLLIFIKTGNRIQEDEFVRGARLVSASQLKGWSALKWRKYKKKHKGRKTAKPLTIAGIPFPPDAVEAQTMLNGTVGVGKTNAMIEMLSIIRENGGKAIIYDRMGGFVSRFYDESTDYLINPFDDRSSSWNPFDDVLDAASFTQLGEVMIPEHRGAASDPFGHRRRASSSITLRGNCTKQSVVP